MVGGGAHVISIIIVVFLAYHHHRGKTVRRGTLSTASDRDARYPRLTTLAAGRALFEIASLTNLDIARSVVGLLSPYMPAKVLDS